MNFTYRLTDANGTGSHGKIEELMTKVQGDFEGAMDDDSNIGLGLAALFDFVREVNNLIDGDKLSKEEAEKVFKLTARFDHVLGVIGEIKREEDLPKEAGELIRRREDARKAKDWRTADQIRQQLRSMGIVVEDTPEGVRWRKEKH